jgi:hypothetical protein
MSTVYSLMRLLQNENQIVKQETRYYSHALEFVTYTDRRIMSYSYEALH